MKRVTIYGNSTCPYCGAARMLLKKKGIEFDDIAISKDAGKRAEMEARSGRTSVPQLFIGEHCIGGFDELCELDKQGKLDELLAD